MNFYLSSQRVKDGTVTHHILCNYVVLQQSFWSALCHNVVKRKCCYKSYKANECTFILGPKRESPTQFVSELNQYPDYVKVPFERCVFVWFGCAEKVLCCALSCTVLLSICLLFRALKMRHHVQFSRHVSLNLRGRRNLAGAEVVAGMTQSMTLACSK